MTSVSLMQIGMADIAANLAFAKSRGSSYPASQTKIPGLKWSQDRLRWEGSPDAVAAFAQAIKKEWGIDSVGVLPMPSDLLDKPRNLAPMKGARDYQVIGSDFLFDTSHWGSLLGDDTGVGKSQQTLSLIKAVLAVASRRPEAVVVCPAVVKAVWQNEVKKWLDDTGIRVRVLSGMRPDPAAMKKITRPTITIVNYDILHVWGPFLEGVEVLVFDEAHMLQNEKARRSVAARKVAASARRRIALTATPLTVRPKDLWNLLDILSPGRFGDFWRFAYRYADAKKVTVAKDTTVWDLSGSSNIEELALRLKWVMLRRSKTEVAIELPPRTRQVVPVHVSSKNRMPIWREGNWGKQGHEVLSRALALAGGGKISQTVDLTVARLTEGHNVIVFSHLRDTARRIQEGIERANVAAMIGLLSGDVSAKERSASIAALRTAAAGGNRVAVSATIDAVGVGIDLSFADIGIFNDLDWVPSKLLQAEGRLWRFPAKMPVTLYYMVALGTVDEYIQNKVIDRLGLYDAVLGSAQEAVGLQNDLIGTETASSAEILADLRRAILAGEVVPEGEEVLHVFEDE